MSIWQWVVESGPSLGLTLGSVPDSIVSYASGLKPLLATVTAGAAAEGDELVAEVDWFAEIQKGGFTAVALLALLGALIFFTVERGFFGLRRGRILAPGLVQKIKPLWARREYDQVLEICRKRKSTLADMACYLTEFRGSDPELLISGANEIGVRELAKHARITNAFAVIGALAPLLGLLGTMIGMIESFRLVEVYGDEGGASMLAGSISKALITTALGLIIAIPSLGLYYFFKHRIGALGQELEEQFDELVNTWLMRRGGESTGPMMEAGSAVELDRERQVAERRGERYLASRGGKWVGPFTRRDLEKHMAAGKLGTDAAVRPEGSRSGADVMPLEALLSGVPAGELAEIPEVPRPTNGESRAAAGTASAAAQE